MATGRRLAAAILILQLLLHLQCALTGAEDDDDGAALLAFKHVSAPIDSHWSPRRLGQHLWRLAVQVDRHFLRRWQSPHAQSQQHVAHRPPHPGRPPPAAPDQERRPQQQWILR
ncbi:unnamed protein product [Urochloa humidicola]